MEVLQNSYIANKYKCSITVEASLIFPLVICILFLLLGPLCIVYTSSNIIISIDNQSKRISYYQMLKENIEKYDDNLLLDKLNNTELNNEVEMINSDDKEDFVLESIENLTNYGLIIYELMKNYDNNNIFNNIKYILPRRENIYDVNSKMITEDIYVHFKLPLNILYLNGVYQRFVNERRAFVGTDGDRYKDIEEEVTDEDLVYIAYNHIYSNVYHSKKSCTYLIKNLEKVNVINISDYKNDSGANYEKCNYCYRYYNTNANIVYITKYGECYHIEENCPRLTAYTKSINKTEADELGLRICEKCKREENNE